MKVIDYSLVEDAAPLSRSLLLPMVAIQSGKKTMILVFREALCVRLGSPSEAFKWNYNYSFTLNYHNFDHLNHNYSKYR